MTLRIISLELARCAEYPNGNSQSGYVFRAPLDNKGRFNRFAWAAWKEFCTVKRIETGEEVEAGLLILNQQGKWVFSYAPGEEDDETLFRLNDHRFVPGEYVSITEHDGMQRTFRVKAVENWRADPAVATAVAS